MSESGTGNLTNEIQGWLREGLDHECVQPGAADRQRAAVIPCKAGQDRPLDSHRVLPAACAISLAALATSGLVDGLSIIVA